MAYAERAIVGTTVKVIELSKTRPSNTTTYAAGGVVNESDSAGTNWIFDDAARVSGGSGRILGATLCQSTAETLKGTYELWLFDTNPVADNDNAAFTPDDTEIKDVIGILTFGLPYVGTASGNVFFPCDPVEIPFVAVGGDTIWGVLVVRNAYVPVSAEVYTIKLMISQD